MELQKAKEIAQAIVNDIAIYCITQGPHLRGPAANQMIDIAGSIRRQKPEVKDIEILISPERGLRNQLAVYFVSKGYTIIKGSFTDRYVQMIVPGKGIKLDLFMPQPHDYYRILAIRTGPAETYSAKVIATGWRKKGWVGTADGLRRETDCIQKGKTWHCHALNPELPPVWQSEREFIEWLGLPYLEPNERF